MIFGFGKCCAVGADSDVLIAALYHKTQNQSPPHAKQKHPQDHISSSTKIARAV